LNVFSDLDGASASESVTRPQPLRPPWLPRGRGSGALSEHEQLEEDIREVLDAFEDETINDRPIGEVVEEICKALGVAFDFTLHSWRELEVPPERCRARPMPPALAALIQAPP
jgi:hypothetical protein